jgi:hypothetical protein
LVVLWVAAAAPSAGSLVVAWLAAGLLSLLLALVLAFVVQ